MIIVNQIGDQITGSVNGKPYGVRFDADKFALMKVLEKDASRAADMGELQAIVAEFLPFTNESYKELIEHAKGGNYLWVNPNTTEVFLTINGKVSNKPLPKEMVDRIIYSVEKKIDVLPLVYAWTRFMRNPHYTPQKAKLFAQYINTTVVNEEYATELMEKQGLHVNVAREKATQYDVSFTQEGLLVTYKVVREIDWKFVADENADGGVKKIDRFTFTVDEITGIKTYVKPDVLEARVFEPAVMGQRYDAFFSGDYEGHIIRVGQPVYHSDWGKVDCNDSRSCEKGLHIGGLRYIKHYQDDDTITLNVFVDPMHIGAMDNSGNGALRVLKFFPHSALTGITQNLYHSSSYAKLTDAEYEAMIAAAVEEDFKTKAKLEAELDAKKNLVIPS